MRWLPLMLFIATLFPGVLPRAAADTSKRGVAPPNAVTYFPLDVGNRWSYREGHFSLELDATVVSRQGNVVVYQIGPAALRLREVQAGVEIDLPGEGFVPYYLFEQDSWVHRDLAGCDDRRVARVLSRDATVTTPAGVFENCLEIAFGDPALCFDAGTVTEWWAPNVGRVKREELNIAGPITWELQSFELNPGGTVEQTFRRGDANDSGAIDLADAVYVLNWLFTGGEEPACLDSADTNDDGKVDLADGVATLGYLFLGKQPPSSPFPDCGADPTEDGLSCQGSAQCGDENQLISFLVSLHDRPQTPEFQYVVATSDPGVIASCREQLSLPEENRLLFVNGALALGDGGFNTSWSWHIVPSGWSLVEMSVEVCSGLPRDVENDLDYWINNIGQFCSWSSFIQQELGSVPLQR